MCPAGWRAGGRPALQDVERAVPHLKAVQAEIRKGEGCSATVLRAHLDEAWIIITSNLADAKTTEDTE